MNQVTSKYVSYPSANAVNLFFKVFFLDVFHLKKKLMFFDDFDVLK